MQNELKTWQASIAECLSIDRFRLNQQLRQIEHCVKQGKPFDRELKLFADALERSRKKYCARKNSVPAIEYPEELPIAARRDEIREAIAHHQQLLNTLIKIDKIQR